MNQVSQKTNIGKARTKPNGSRKPSSLSRDISLRINGEKRGVNVDPRMPLLWVLRDLLNLTGTKYSCGIGVCGSCTIHFDGQAIRSCTTPVSDAEGVEVTTIEGLSREGDHPLQKAWITENVSQCGYCQPGQIMTAAALLNENPDPTQVEIDAVMAGTLCRCGTQLRIRRAVQRAAAEINQS